MNTYPYKLSGLHYYPPKPKWYPDPLWIILAIVITIFLVTMAINVWGAEISWDKFSNEQIVEAIGRAENSIKYPYGIKSINTKGNKEYARQICLNSVRNGRVRWIMAGRPDDLITFIGKRFCPPTTHKLNTNWISNVKFYLTKYRKLARQR